MREKADNSENDKKRNTTKIHILILHNGLPSHVTVNGIHKMHVCSPLNVVERKFTLHRLHT